MFIAIVGTRFAGKSTIEEYLINEKGFTPVRLIEPNDGDSSLDGEITVRLILSFREMLLSCGRHSP